ncbi:hypothetical protein ACHAXT_011260 [Thalassiosira profunda]
MRRYLVLHGILVVGCDAFGPIAIIAPRAAPSSESSLLHIGRARRGRSLAAVNAGSAEDLSKLTVPELKDKLRERGLAVGGRKNDLIERLVTERNIVDESPGDLSTSDEPQSPVLQSEKEDFSQLTVPALKARLKQQGLPVGGRKAELIERLKSAVDEEYVGNLDATAISSDGTDPPSSSGNNDDSLLLGILDEILEDVDDEDDEDDEELFNEPRSDLPSPLSEGDGETASARRARRKKYWQTQGVRELIKANNPTAATKAEEMISALEKMAEEEKNEEYLPGPVQYTMLIDAYAKRGTTDAIQKAEEVIDRILESDAQSDGAAVISAQMLNSLMGAYANMGTVESAEKAMALLDRMEYLKNFGGSVKPTVHSYSIAISAWVKCESEQAAMNAENVLNRLFEEYDTVLQSDEPSDELRPNNFVFNSAIDAWARSGSPKAGEKAEELLHRMEVLSHLDSYDVRPDTITFNTCINCWCNSDREDAPLKAEAVLAKLETNPQYPKRMGGVLTVRPNRLSYNTVINSWAKSSLPEAALRAEGILLRMIKSFKSDTFATITPDSVTFASVLNALAKSKRVLHKAEKCAAILKAMIELHEDDGSQDTRPNIICFNTVLNACAFSAHTSEEERRRALAVAVEVFNSMRRGKFVSPDAVSFGNMLKSVANLMPPGDQRNAMASRLFASCCDEGLVGGMCLDEIRRCIPPRAFLPLLADCGWDKPIKQRRKAHSVQLRDLPRAWTANVKRGDMKSRQRSFAKPEKKQERPRVRREEKERPVFRRPRQVIEYGASGKDMM